MEILTVTLLVLLAYFAIGTACAWIVFPKAHLALMHEYVEKQYDYSARLSKAPGVSEKSAAAYRKEMRICAREGERWKTVLPEVPFFVWCLRWPLELLVCAKLGFLIWDVSRKIRKWDSKTVSR